MNFGGRQPHLVGIGRSAVPDPMQNALQFVVVADQLQQRLAVCTRQADTQQGFGRRIEPVDQQAVIDDDDRGIQLFRDGRPRWRVAGVRRSLVFSGTLVA